MRVICSENMNMRKAVYMYYGPVFAYSDPPQGKAQL